MDIIGQRAVKAGHTPGPWRFTPELSRYGYRVFAVNGDAELGNWSMAERVFRPEDARLIAAAPDLLAALERIALASYQCTHQQMWMPMQEEARAAIAKAEAAP